MDATAKLLIIEEEDRMRSLLEEALTRHGFAVRTCEDGPVGIALVEHDPPDLILADVRLPGMDGIEALRRIKELAPDTIVVLMTAFYNIDNAVEAMREGAFDYVSKPFKIDEMILRIEKALEQRSLRSRVGALQREVEKRYQFGNITGKSAPMQEVFRLIEQVAPSRSTVMIYGKSGTGKELVAKAIHYNSPRKDHPFVPVNCAAIPGELQESEMFGHERGAFTGAIQPKVGKFELANTGTLFLDEVGTMRLDLQAKILRALKEREFTRVGGARTIQLDVRVIATTNLDLRKAVEEGTFRSDLYYCLHVVPISVPPLRERQEDIPLLAAHFLKRFAAEAEKPIRAIAPEAMKLLIGYAWPGNVRELENCIERAVTLTQHDTIRPEDLPPNLHETAGPVEKALAVDASLEDLERQYIREVLRKTRGHQIRAAEILGIDRRTLYRKIRQYGLKAEEESAN